MEEDYEVENILDHRISGRSYQNLVSWMGYPLERALWLPAEECEELQALDVYEASRDSPVLTTQLQQLSACVREQHQERDLAQIARWRDWAWRRRAALELATAKKVTALEKEIRRQRQRLQRQQRQRSGTPAEGDEAMSYPMLGQLAHGPLPKHFTEPGGSYMLPTGLPAAEKATPQPPAVKSPPLQYTSDEEKLDAMFSDFTPTDETPESAQDPEELPDAQPAEAAIVPDTQAE